MTKPILVLGDAMIDYHLYGSSDRISPEAPVPIVKAIEEQYSLGAAGNVAAHITSAGYPCVFAYKVNKKPSKSDASHSLLDILLQEANIKPFTLEHPKRAPITIKRRIWSNSQQICRIDEEDVATPNRNLEYEWVESIYRLINEKQFGAVIISDYNKGTLTDTMIMQIANHCKGLGIPTILDPKRPMFYKIEDLTIVKPNKSELDSTTLSLVQCSRRLKNTYLVNTLGKDGMVVYQNGRELCSCPTIAKNVYDVTGCGDSCAAVMGIGLYQGLDIEEVMKAANKAASFTIRNLGCYVLTKEEIEESLAFGVKSA